MSSLHRLPRYAKVLVLRQHKFTVIIFARTALGPLAPDVTCSLVNNFRCRRHSFTPESTLITNLRSCTSKASKEGNPDVSDPRGHRDALSDGPKRVTRPERLFSENVREGSSFMERQKNRLTVTFLQLSKTLNRLHSLRSRSSLWEL